MLIQFRTGLGNEVLSDSQPDASVRCVPLRVAQGLMCSARNVATRTKRRQSLQLRPPSAPLMTATKRKASGTRGNAAEIRSTRSTALFQNATLCADRHNSFGPPSGPCNVLADSRRVSLPDNLPLSSLNPLPINVPLVGSCPANYHQPPPRPPLPHSRSPPCTRLEDFDSIASTLHLSIPSIRCHAFHALCPQLLRRPRLQLAVAGR